MREYAAQIWICAIFRKPLKLHIFTKEVSTTFLDIFGTFNSNH